MLKSLINQQYGLLSAKDRLPAVDSLLSHLTCHQDDEHPGIYSTSNSAPSSDLLYACRFSHSSGYEHILALANEDGKIALQNTKVVGKGRPIHGFQVHENAIFDICWSPSSSRIVTGSGDQTSVLLDIGSSSINPVSVFRGHTASIKTVDFSPNPSIFASGSRDGSIIIWDVRTNHASISKAENLIRNAHPVNTPCIDMKSSRTKKRTTPSGAVSNSVTAVVFQTDNTLISSGAADGNIHIWDLRKNYTVFKGDPLPKMKIPYGSWSTRSGVTSLCLNPGKTLLYVASMDDVIYEFNVASYDENPVGIYGGHDQHSFYIKSCLSGDGNYLLSGSSDDFAYIWKVGGGPQPLLKLEGHGAEVTCVAWSANDISKVVTCADDVRHRIWRLNPRTEVDEDEERRIRGRAITLGTQSSMPIACEQIYARLKKKTIVPAQTCKTPIASSRVTPLSKDLMGIQGSPSTSRAVLSPLKTNIGITPDNQGSRSSYRDRSSGASRRLQMDATEYLSPTRNLPNYVIDGLSPHSSNGIVRSASKRKKLDWLTDLSRKISPNPKNKVRRIK